MGEPSEVDKSEVAQVIGGAVRRHESWEDCTCPDGNEDCWYRLTDAEQDSDRGWMALLALEAEGYKIVRDSDA